MKVNTIIPVKRKRSESPKNMKLNNLEANDLSGMCNVTLSQRAKSHTDICKQQ